MAAKDLYQRYRRWADQFGQWAIVVISVSAAMVAVVVLSLAGSDGRAAVFWKVLPWMMLVGGPIAALDAWGAAAFRGRAVEGVARAVVIVALCWGFAAYAFLR